MRHHGTIDLQNTAKPHAGQGSQMRLPRDPGDKVNNRNVATKTQTQTTPNRISLTTIAALYNPLTAMRQRGKDIMTRCGSWYVNH